MTSIEMKKSKVKTPKDVIIKTVQEYKDLKKELANKKKYPKHNETKLDTKKFKNLKNKIINGVVKKCQKL